jgi:hypothetical protein
MNNSQRAESTVSNHRRVGGDRWTPRSHPTRAMDKRSSVASNSRVLSVPSALFQPIPTPSKQIHTRLQNGWLKGPLSSRPTHVLGLVHATLSNPGTNSTSNPIGTNAAGSNQYLWTPAIDDLSSFARTGNAPIYCVWSRPEHLIFATPE